MRVTGLVLCAALAACGVSHDGDEDETGATLAIEPPTVELLIIDGVAATQPYTATLTYPDGHSRDVTDSTTFTVDSAFGSFTDALATIGTPGKTSVFGQHHEAIGQGSLIARLKTRRVDPSLPPNTPDLFTGPDDPARAPSIVYPADSIILPRNIGDFETHWTDGFGNDVFEVSVTTEFADLRVYVPGGNGDAAAGPMASFTAFSPGDWLSAVGVEPSFHYQVRGVQTANPTSVGASPARLVALTNEALDGGMYYWQSTPSATDPVEGIYRHDMANPGQAAEPYMTVGIAGKCVACHVLSRDGTKMAITYDGGNGAGTMIDVASATPQAAIATWNFGTFTPDSSQLLTVFSGALTVRSSADQSVLATMPTGGAVSHPDLSPDGTQLVYVRTSGGSDWDFGGGDIYTRSYDQTTHTFGAEIPLILHAGGVNNFYPSWSPDGKWIMFNQSSGGGAYNNGNAQLFVVKADGTAAPIELTTANIGLGLTNAWGRWAPFSQTVNGSEPIFWVTVSSKRNFGVRLFNIGRPQIWMTPFFPERANNAQDPTVPAFHLSFQNIGYGNHIAQWTERIVTL